MADPTLMDLASRLDPDGDIAAVVEILSDTNQILEDMVFGEGNLTTGHRTTVRSGLPTIAWRKLNAGVASSKSSTRQIDANTGMLEGYSEVDKKLADLGGNTAAFRASEDAAFLEAFNQEMAQTLFYGDTDTAPEEFLGLSSYFDSLGTDDTASSFNVVTGGGSGSDNMSIWLVGWGMKSVWGCYPKGSMMGFQIEDKGQETLQDASGNNYEGYRTHYSWDLGLVVQDWRYISRIANIDYSDLVANSSPPNLIELMIQAMHKLPTLDGIRPVFYCNRDAYTWLDIQTLETSNAALTYKEIHGKPVMTFRGVPVRRCDALLNSESTIS